MSYVHRQTYKGGRKSANFYISFCDQVGVHRKMPTPTRDEEAAREYLRKLEWLISCRVSKLPIEPELSQWIQGIPLPYRQRLADIGLIDAVRVAGGRLLSTVLQECETAALGRACKRKTAVMQRQRATKVFELAGFKVLSDISRSAVERALAKLVEDGLSHQSRNHYLAAAREFCGWTVSQGWATTNPVQGIARLNVSAHRCRRRRALEPEEVTKLLEAAAKGQKRKGMLGPERRVLYLFAIESGLRKEELAALTVMDLSLDGDAPSVRLRAETTKNKQEDELPLSASTAAELKALIEGRRLLPERAPTAPVFKLPKFWRSAAMIVEDLADAGILKRREPEKPKQPEKTEQPAPTEGSAKRKRKGRPKRARVITTDADGYSLDFHTLRHTTSTYLARAGVPVAAHQAIMRHSDPRLSIGVYTHLRRSDKRSAMAKLPDFSGAGRPTNECGELRATGSGGPHVCSQVCSNSVHSGAPQSNDMQPEAAGRRTRRDSNTQQPVPKTDALSN